MSAVHIEDLCKSFRTTVPAQGGSRWNRLFAREETLVEAVKGISFDIEAGERVAFIGPNGAGKSTTLKMLSGILQPDSGQVRVLGFHPWSETRAMARHIGIVFGQRTQLWPHLPVRASFALLAKIYDIGDARYRQREAHLAELFQIEALLDRPAKALSLGQRMRADIAASLLHEPAVLFLDEPTIGLDVTAKALLRDHLKSLSDLDGLTLLLTSHDTGDIEEITDRVILINRGEKLIDEPLSNLRSRFLGSKQLVLATEEADPALSLPGVRTVRSGRHELVLEIDLGKTSLESVIRAALGSLAIKDIAIDNAPLDDIIRQIYRDAA